jgi:hypothetical protein
MSREIKSPNRVTDTPRDKPVTERTEHANLERPGAQAHPRARGWSHSLNPLSAWRLR